MTLSIPFYLGVSRNPPYTVFDRRLPPDGQEMPRPFDVQHQWRQLAGRSPGGFYHLTDFEAMTWIYRVGADAAYTRLLSVYTPVNPWVWLHVLDPQSGDGAWFEGAMHEPIVARTAGRVVSSVSVQFSHLWRYEA